MSNSIDNLFDHLEAEATMCLCFTPGKNKVEPVHGRFAYRKFALHKISYNNFTI